MDASRHFSSRNSLHSCGVAEGCKYPKQAGSHKFVTKGWNDSKTRDPAKFANTDLGPEFHGALSTKSHNVYEAEEEFARCPEGSKEACRSAKVNRHFLQDVGRADVRVGTRVMKERAWENVRFPR